MPIFMTDEQISEIIDEIKDERRKRQYLEDIQPVGKAAIQGLFIYDYKREPGIFSKKAQNILKQTLNTRWEKFNVVVDRLNAPELVDYYERERFE